MMLGFLCGCLVSCRERNEIYFLGVTEEGDSDSHRAVEGATGFEIVFHPQCSRLAWCKVLGNEGERGQSPNKTVLSVEQGEGCWCFTNVE